jgi:hypothetical protein
MFFGMGPPEAKQPIIIPSLYTGTKDFMEAWGFAFSENSHNAVRRK